MGDLATFGIEWMRSPLGVGAIAPSGPLLAALITQDAGSLLGPIIELGPGTGVFTRALLNNGVPEEQIAVVERGEAFLADLARHHPRLHAYHGDAANLAHMNLFGPGWAAMVVCGLPLLSMPPSKVYRILAGAFFHLSADAPFRLFTYAPGCPIPSAVLDRLGLGARKIGRTTFNLPPACVWELRRVTEPRTEKADTPPIEEITP